MGKLNHYNYPLYDKIVRLPERYISYLLMSETLKDTLFASQNLDNVERMIEESR